MNGLGAALMAIVVGVVFGGSIHEKKLRMKELARHKIAAYLSCEDGYEKQIFSDEFYLGSGKNADVRIPLSAGEVAPIHAYFYREGEYFYIQNVAREMPVYVENEDGTIEISYGEKNILKNSNKIKIGGHIINFRRGGLKWDEE